MLFQSWINVMIISLAWVIVSGLADCSGAELQSQRTKEDQDVCLLFIGRLWKNQRSSERGLVHFLHTLHAQFSKQPWDCGQRDSRSCSPFFWNTVFDIGCWGNIRTGWQVGDLIILFQNTWLKKIQWFKKITVKLKREWSKQVIITVWQDNKML